MEDEFPKIASMRVCALMRASELLLNARLKRFVDFADYVSFPQTCHNIYQHIIHYIKSNVVYLQAKFEYMPCSLKRHSRAIDISIASIMTREI